jgi:putative membrane protein
VSARKIILLVLLVVIAVFILQNTEVIQIRFLLWKATLSEAIVLFASLGIGFLSGWLIATFRPKRDRP